MPRQRLARQGLSGHGMVRLAWLGAAWLGLTRLNWARQGRHGSTPGRRAGGADYFVTGAVQLVAQVTGPTLPSWVKPFCFWKATAVSWLC